MSKRTHLLDWLLPLVALVPWAILMRRFWFVCDDAFISFRYADHWARGLGLRYNLGVEPPVEGFSNFLWVSIAAGLQRLGQDMVVAVPWVSALAAAVLALVVARVLRRMEVGRWLSFCILLGLVTAPAHVIWSTSGLETMAFTLFFFLTVERLFLRRQPALRSAALFGLLLALTRTEGIYWALLFGLLRLLVGGVDGRRNTVLGRYFVLLLLPYGIYFIARFLYFGDVFSNTTHAKVEPDLVVLQQGLDYVCLFALTCLTPLLVLPAAGAALWQRAPLRSGLRITALLVFGVIAYAILVGGDFMAMGRFLMPLLPLQAVLLGCWLARVAVRGNSGRIGAGVLAVGAVALGVLPLFEVHLVPTEVRERFHFRTNAAQFRSEAEQWEFMRANTERRTRTGLVLRKYLGPDESLVCGAIGAIGYYSGLFLYDRYGLVNRDVAHRDRKRKERSPGHEKAVRPEFFMKYSPTYLDAQVISARNLREAVRKEGLRWKDRPAGEDYVADFLVLDEARGGQPGAALFLLRAIEEQLTVRQAWGRFERKLEREL